MKYFAARNMKEILRDKLNLFFGLLFPLLILVLLFILNKNIPAQANMTLFRLENLTPGVGVFGLSFVSLFGGMLIARDRSESFLIRLFSGLYAAPAAAGACPDSLLLYRGLRHGPAGRLHKHTSVHGGVHTRCAAVHRHWPSGRQLPFR